MAGWWFRTFRLFFHSVGNFIIPPDFHSIIFQRGRAQSATSHLYRFQEHVLKWPCVLVKSSQLKTKMGDHIPSTPLLVKSYEIPMDVHQLKIKNHKKKSHNTNNKRDIICIGYRDNIICIGYRDNIL